MSLYRTEWSITSDVTPEWAVRVDRVALHSWRLSWLPDRLVTRDQAVAGMELDELLSEPGGVADPDLLTRADRRAAQLFIRRDHAVILLARRSAARLRDGSTEPLPALGNR
ncbi:hypothetical protein ACWDSJ_35095 [Nocardia sp. NPDC003482]|uniref:hypothetical protein n=1 Tax=Nocardia sp. NPDC004068 TaxID=3364303 RepID=UPI0036C889A9